MEDKARPDPMIGDRMKSAPFLPIPPPCRMRLGNWRCPV
jgi:hypothetical protein